MDRFNFVMIRPLWDGVAELLNWTSLLQLIAIKKVHELTGKYRNVNLDPLILRGKIEKHCALMNKQKKFSKTNRKVY